MKKEAKAVRRILRRVYVFMELRRWNSEARRALRGADSYRAEVALCRVDLLTKMI